jgi:copper(I)-binding protein
MSFKLFALALTAALALATASAQTSQPQVTNAWARATSGTSQPGVAYLTIQSATPDRLVAASTPVAKTTELHTMSMSGGVMQMRPAAGIDIPVGQPVTLKPGGEHIMLMGLDHALREGQHFPLTLTFEKAGAREVTVAVEKAGATAPGTAARH